MQLTVEIDDFELLTAASVADDPLEWLRRQIKATTKARLDGLAKAELEHRMANNEPLPASREEAIANALVHGRGTPNLIRADGGTFYQAPPLDTGKALKRAALSALYREARDKPIAHTVDGKEMVFDADDRARANIAAAVTALPNATTARDWYARDGSAAAMRRPDLQGLLQAIEARTQRLYEAKKAAEAAVDAATTPEAALAVDTTAIV